MQSTKHCKRMLSANISDINTTTQRYIASHCLRSSPVADGPHSGLVGGSFEAVSARSDTVLRLLTIALHARAYIDHLSGKKASRCWDMGYRLKATWCQLTVVKRRFQLPAAAADEATNGLAMMLLEMEISIYG